MVRSATFEQLQALGSLVGLSGEPDAAIPSKVQETAYGKGLGGKQPSKLCGAGNEQVLLDGYGNKREKTEMPLSTDRSVSWETNEKSAPARELTHQTEKWTNKK